jgi:hypothetical protein
MDTNELEEARFHLSEFDKIPEDPKGIYHLSLGTSLLMEIIEGNFEEDQQSVAKNIMHTYLNKVYSRIDKIIKESNSVDIPTFVHWKEIYDNFDDFVQVMISEQGELKQP